MSEELVMRVARLLNESDSEVRSYEFLDLLKTWTADQVIACLAARAWLEPASCFRMLGASSALQTSARKLKTIGIYYFRMGMGGAERVIVNLINLWLNKGYRVVFLTEGEQQDGDYALPEDVARVVLPDFRCATPDNYGQRAQVIKSKLEEHEIDVVVYCQWLSHVFPWDMMLCKALDVPVVVYTHGSFRTMLCEADPLDYQQAIVYGYADGIVTLSETDQHFWEAFNPRVWRTINPVTIAPCRDSVSSLEDKIIVWVGRLSPYDKQPTEALNIMRLVLNVQPDARLFMVGPAPDEDTFLSLRQEADDLGISDQVEFVGAQDDVAAFLRRASVYLLTSRYEGYCLSLAESKAVGLPCVMYELPYLSLVHGDCGITAVPQNDREAAAAAICSLLSNKEQRMIDGKKAFEHIELFSQFDVDSLWDDIFSSIECGSAARVHFVENDLLWDTLFGACLASFDKLRFTIEDRDRCLADANHRAKLAEAAVQELHDSTSFRVGMALTAIPRKFKDAR